MDQINPNRSGIRQEIINRIEAEFPGRILAVHRASRVVDLHGWPERSHGGGGGDRNARPPVGNDLKDLRLARRGR